MKKYHSIKDELFIMQSIARKQAHTGILIEEKLDTEELFPDKQMLQYLKQELLHSAYETIRHIEPYTFSFED